MPFPIQLSREQYSALVTLARDGTKDANGQIIANKARSLEAFLASLESDAGITRYGVWIQWQEAGVQLPPTTRFPEIWPPEQRYYLEIVERPISRSDVDTALAKRATTPMNVLLTKDPGGVVGWTELDKFFQ